MTVWCKQKRNAIAPVVDKQTFAVFCPYFLPDTLRWVRGQAVPWSEHTLWPGGHKLRQPS